MLKYIGVSIIHLLVRITNRCMEFSVASLNGGGIHVYEGKMIGENLQIIEVPIYTGEDVW